MTETPSTPIIVNRAHHWLPSRQGVRSVCVRCGIIRQQARTDLCYVEEVMPDLPSMPDQPSSQSVPPA